MTENVGSINSGTIEDTRIADANYLILNELTNDPGYDYQFYFENIPAIPSFGVRFEGYYNGNIAHEVYVRAWNFTDSQWDELPYNRL